MKAINKKLEQSKKSVVTKFDKENSRMKLTSAEQQNVIYRLMSGLPTFLDIHGLNITHAYKVHHDKHSNPIILEHNKNANSYKMVTEEIVCSNLFHQYNDFASEMAADGLPMITLDSVTKGVRVWLHQLDEKLNETKLNEYPVQTRLKSESGSCFVRLDYDPVKVDNLEEQAPLFSKMLGRMTNSDAFVKKIGSLFDKKAYRKQSLWLYGPTDGGKSVIQSLIIRMLGGELNCVSMTPALMNSPFFKEILVNRGIWLVREAKSAFLNSDEYKSLTGDSFHIINPKGRRMYGVDLTGTMIFASNGSPEIRDEDALLRRVIPICCSAVPEEDRLDGDDLWEEFDKEIPYIAGYCIGKYSEVKGNGFIAFDDKALREGIDESNYEISAKFSQHFVFDDKLIRPSNVQITATHLVKVIDPYGHGGGRSSVVRDFRKYLRGLGCNPSFQVKKNGRNVKYITKIRKKTAQEQCED